MKGILFVFEESCLESYELLITKQPFHSATPLGSAFSDQTKGRAAAKAFLGAGFAQSYVAGPGSQ